MTWLASVVALLSCFLFAPGVAEAICSPSVKKTLRVDPSQPPSATIFASLEQALLASRQIPTPRNVTIELAPPANTKTYTLNQQKGLLLGKEDSCLRIVGLSREGSMKDWDHITFGLKVPVESVMLLSAETSPEKTWRRVRPEARGHVYSFDFKSMNLTHTRQWPDTYNVGDPTTTTFGLYFAGQRLKLARYPKPDENMSSAYPNVHCMGREACVGGIPMKAAVAGTSKDWLAGDHKTKSRFSVYDQTITNLTHWASAVEHGLYLEGNWRVDFMVTGARVESLDLNGGVVQLAAPMPGGVGWKYTSSSKGCGCEPFYAVNALELISQELEYALDWRDGKVYIWLPYAASNQPDPRSLLTVVDYQGAGILIDSAEQVILESVRLGYSLGSGVEVRGGRNVQLLGLVAHDVGGDGVALVAASDSTVRSSDLYNIGNRGVLISGGGEVMSLTPSKSSVLNCHFWNIGLNGILLGEAISIVNQSVGARVAHNLIHHVSGEGIHGGDDTSVADGDTAQGHFNTLIEYNEVFQVGLNGSGFAAVYSCCNPVDAAGGVWRYNFVHSSPNVNGFGWDNQLSGQTGYGNVFYYMQNGFGLNHGSYNSMTNNLIVLNSPKPAQTAFQADAGISVACRGFKDVYNCSLKDSHTLAWNKLLRDVAVDDPTSAWGKKFGWYLSGICDAIATVDGVNQRVVGNYAMNNAMVYIGKTYSVAGCTDVAGEPPLNNTFGDTYQLLPNGTQDPGFADYAKLNFTLRDDSPIFKSLPDFKPIPFSSIGLFLDTWRKVLPNDREIGRLVFAPHLDELLIV